MVHCQKGGSSLKERLKKEKEEDTRRRDHDIDIVARLRSEMESYSLVLMLKSSGLRDPKGN